MWPTTSACRLFDGGFNHRRVSQSVRQCSRRDAVSVAPVRGLIGFATRLPHGSATLHRGLESVTRRTASSEAGLRGFLSSRLAYVGGAATTDLSAFPHGTTSKRASAVLPPMTSVACTRQSPGGSLSAKQKRPEPRPAAMSTFCEYQGRSLPSGPVNST